MNTSKALVGTFLLVLCMCSNCVADETLKHSHPELYQIRLLDLPPSATYEDSLAALDLSHAAWIQEHMGDPVTYAIVLGTILGAQPSELTLGTVFGSKDDSLEIRDPAYGMAAKNYSLVVARIRQSTRTFYLGEHAFHTKNHTDYAGAMSSYQRGYVFLEEGADFCGIVRRTHHFVNGEDELLNLGIVALSSDHKMADVLMQRTYQFLCHYFEREGIEIYDQ